MISEKHLESLIQEAKELGISECAIIPSSQIQVKEDLAALCNGDYTCPNYGLAASCPPHVAGPAQFRKWQAQSRYAITVKIEAPTSVMFSDERKTVMQLLHQAVAVVEQKAVEMGFDRSKAFAGGSCRELFCDDQKDCCVITGHAPCRHKDLARPSMSGFGIDVTQLMISSGWSALKADAAAVSDAESTTWVAGLILVA